MVIEIVEELLDVDVEVGQPTVISWEETKDFHGAVWSRVDIPIATCNINGRNLGTDGVDTTNACKPFDVSWVLSSNYR